jgi:DNA-binding winged helix-turn-helix (wHTH) protein/tetratricopeptide (TPR) repeat protein
VINLNVETKVLRFGVFEINLATEELRKDGTLIKLPPQPFKILALLAGQAGHLVTREQIQQQIWGDETFVDFEQGLNHCIKQIRAVLVDNAETPRYLQTLPRRGYRFIAPVEVRNLTGTSGPAEDHGGALKGGAPTTVASILRPDGAWLDPSPVRSQALLQEQDAPQGSPASGDRTALTYMPAATHLPEVPEIALSRKSPQSVSRARVSVLAWVALALVMVIVAGASYYLLRGRRTVQKAQPSNPEAARLYSQGLQKLRVLDAVRAQEFLEKALAVEPGFAPSHSALAEAWKKLGYDEKAKEEAKKAVDLSASLSRQDRLAVEARYLEMTNQLDQAVDLYRKLWSDVPHDLDCGLRLASAETRARKAKDALATVEALRKFPAPSRDDPRIDLAEAEAAESLEDYKQEQAAARKAAVKAEAQGSGLLLARAQVEQATAVFRQGDPAEAQNMYGRARVIYHNSGNMKEEASSWSNIATMLQEQGNFAPARGMYQRALDIYLAIGNEREAAVTLNDIGALLQRQGDFAGAESRYKQSLVKFLQIGDKPNEAAALDNIAEVLYGQGDLAGARSTYERALAMDHDLADEEGVAYALFKLGEIFAVQGDLVGARTKNEEALAIRQGLDDKVGAAQSRLALAELYLEEEHPEHGEALARKAAEEFRNKKLNDEEAHAEAVLALSLLKEEKLPEASKSVARATTLAKESENPSLRLTVEITDARIRAATGSLPDQTEALKSLRHTLAEATKSHFVDLQLEARLALGDTEIKTRHSDEGHARLEALEKDATVRGFGLIARKAAAARRQSSTSL